MAKISWRFVDESGTNLNRYILENVATGERVEFNLSRNANIVQAGTPLNASNLNALITAINELYDGALPEQKYLHNVRLESSTFVISFSFMSTDNTPVSASNFKTILESLGTISASGYQFANNIVSIVSKIEPYNVTFRISVFNIGGNYSTTTQIAYDTTMSVYDVVT